jgi:hypothetical protein
MQLLGRLGIVPEEYQADKDSQQQEDDLHRALNEHKNDHLFYRAG